MVKRINGANMQHSIRCVSNVASITTSSFHYNTESVDCPFLPPLMQYVRIFNNGSFDEGGRFYADFQLIPSELRKNLHIDNEQTAEFDYSAAHITMLYHKMRIDIKQDPYDNDMCPRELMKTV